MNKRKKKKKGSSLERRIVSKGDPGRVKTKLKGVWKNNVKTCYQYAYQEKRIPNV